MRLWWAARSQFNLRTTPAIVAPPGHLKAIRLPLPDIPTTRSRSIQSPRWEVRNIDSIEGPPEWEQDSLGRPTEALWLFLKAYRQTQLGFGFPCSRWPKIGRASCRER